MDTLPRVDVVIVGGGWGGLVMAKEIASRTSLSVLLLERGGPVRSNTEYAAGMDEVDYEIRLRQMQNIAELTFTHRPSSRDRAAPIRQYGRSHQATGVGGLSEYWGGTSPRFLPEQFTLATHLREKYGAARLPENLAVKDWGVTWDEMEPYYWRAEQMMGICGKAGNLRGKQIEGGNIFEGPRSHEFPLPPHTMPYSPTLFTKSAIDLGYHPFPMPTATLSQNYRNPDGVVRSGCMSCGHCVFYGCMVGAKASPTSTMLPVLKTKKNFSLRTNCWVRRVIHRDGKAVGVTYMDASGAEVTQPADTVVLAAWTFNNTRLLMLSKIGEPYNPESGKGTLGTNLTQNVNQNSEFFLDKSLNNFMGAGGLGMAISEFAGDLPDAEVSAGALRGGVIMAQSAGTTPIVSFGRIPEGEVESNWGSKWKEAALKWTDKASGFVCAASHFSYRHNYMDLDPTYTDKWGDPLLRLTSDWTEHDRREAAMLAKVQRSLAKAMGATGYAERGIVNGPPGTAGDHMQGGAIMGNSPEQSVTNTWMQHWNMPNLWVVGGSAFPQNDGQPTLTTVAVSYRAADGFVDRYMKRPGALI